jgi:3-keto-5-aminohexanoate cleavage enzyme
MPSSLPTELAGTGTTPASFGSSPALAIAVAPNGARKTARDHPALPISPRELAECAAACRDAGASMLHLHVRDGAGRHSLAPADYRPAIEAVRSAVGRSLVLQLTSEAVGIYAPAEQRAMIRELRPEAVSLGLREMLPEGGGESGEEREAASFLAWAHREHIVVQLILYDADDVRRYAELRRRAVIPEGRHWVLFVLGRYTPGQRSTLADLLPFVAAWQAAGAISAAVPWAICAFGPREIECGLGAAALGGHLRVGFENNVRLPDGRIARDNAELVACAADLARHLGHKIATAEGLREMFA